MQAARPHASPPATLAHPLPSRPPVIPDRGTILAVIRDLRDTVAADPARGAHGLPEGRVVELVRTTCEAHGLAVGVWISGVEADPEIGRLLVDAVHEAFVESPDPGPYDTISRESAAGQAEPEAFEHDAHLLGWDARWIDEPVRDVQRLRRMILGRTAA